MSRQPGSKRRRLPCGLAILHEDRDVIVVYKPDGLLTMATDRERERTAYYFMTDYVRKGCAKSHNRIFIVHRLDRDTSGVLVFARNEEAKLRLQGQWDETEKQYLAVVHGRVEKQSGTITTYLAENAAHVVYSTTDPAKGKLAHTAYRVLKTGRNVTLLEINLLTGRKNQIRVHLAGIGHPIVGDRKYGRMNDSCRRLALHARSIAFRHPFTDAKIVVTAEPPAHLRALVDGLP